MTTTIQKWGNSQGIRIPKMLLDSVQWKENEQITIVVENNRIIIEKVKDKSDKKRKNIKELFADYKGEYEPIKIDWGKLEGKEIW